MKVVPDRKLAWQNAFRLQRLLIERQILRLQYLYEGGVFCNGLWKSLTSIEKRLDQEWSEDEEATLKEGKPIYDNVSREIQDCRLRFDPAALVDAARVLERDVKYRDARLAHVERMKKLREQLGA